MDFTGLLTMIKSNSDALLKYCDCKTVYLVWERLENGGRV